MVMKRRGNETARPGLEVLLDVDTSRTDHQHQVIAPASIIRVVVPTLCCPNEVTPIKDVGHARKSCLSFNWVFSGRKRPEALRSAGCFARPSV